MRGGASWRGMLWTVLQQTRPLAPLLPQQRHARGGTVPPPYLSLSLHTRFTFRSAADSMICTIELLRLFLSSE